MPIKLTPIEATGPNNQGTVSISYRQLVSLIGFEPNATHLDDPYKVKASWGFQDEAGREGYVWCYKEPTAEDCTRWSTAGHQGLLSEVFGGHYAPNTRQASW